MKLPFHWKKITGRFGTLSEFRRRNGMQAHSGVDFALPIGTPIPALDRGTIVLQQWSNVLGNVLVLRVLGYDPDGDKSKRELYYIGYCHLDDKGLPVGTRVKEGDIIARSGNTGGATTGPHVHITVSKEVRGVFGPTSVKQDLIEFVKANK